RGGNLRLAIFERDFGLAGNGFAQAVTIGDDVRRLEIEEIEDGEVEPGDGFRIGARRKFDVSVRSTRARPLHIERGLELIAVLTRVGAVGINLLEVAVREIFQTEHAAEGIPIGWVEEVRVFDRGNGDA